MKYLKSYKIFESANSLVDKYLGVLGTTRDEVSEIFLELTDQGYKLKFGFVYKDSDGRSRNKRTMSKETPILFISFDTNRTGYVGGSTEFDSITYIETIYHSLSRFMDMFEDKVKIKYELDSKSELTIKCFFETEVDEDKLDVTKKDIKSCLDETLRDYLPNHYVVDTRVDWNGVYSFIEMFEDEQVKRANELIQSLKNSDEKYLSNYDDEIKPLQDELTKQFAKKLSEKTNSDIRYFHKMGESPGLFLYKDGEKSRRVGGFSCYDDGTKTFRSKIKTGFLSRKDIEIGLFYKIQITVTLD